MFCIEINDHAHVKLKLYPVTLSNTNLLTTIFVVGESLNQLMYGACLDEGSYRLLPLRIIKQDCLV